ncbi:MAG: hypothetical protein JSS76_00470 [Bacteroidetes bacterium]|nr:hypothetical protein [Bacteroidota bacterium]
MKKVLQYIYYFINDIKSGARFRLINFLSLEQGILYKTANLIAAEKIEGDYLEFGVYSGGSFIEAYSVLKHAFGPHQKIHGERTEQDVAELNRIWGNMRFFAFDSFQGLPDLEGIDKEARDFAKGKYTCPEDVFCKNLTKAGVPLTKVIRVAGLFQETCISETIERYEIKKAAVIHIDCDLYTSTKTALEFVKPLLVDGTIIIFDDWFCFRGNPNLGEQKAFNEWQKSLPDWIFSEYQRTGPWTVSFIASRRVIN